VSLSTPASSSGSAKPFDAQAERGSGLCEYVIGGGDGVRSDSGRDREMKRVERPERDCGDTDQNIAGADGMPIFKRMYLEKSLRYIAFKGPCHPVLRRGIDFSVPAAASHQAPQLDCRETAD
jgi:hypothetical protein